MGFGSTVRNSELVARCEQLLTPFGQHFVVPAARSSFDSTLSRSSFGVVRLHGVSGCPLGEAHLAKLRSKATAALHIRPSGVSSMLRVSLADPMGADPGFYQFWCVIRDARRLRLKSVGVLQAWRQFMQMFSGTTFHGPFSKMILVFSQVGWSVQWPPAFRDHQGVCHDLLRLPLRFEGWLRMLGFSLSPRSTAIAKPCGNCWASINAWSSSILPSQVFVKFDLTKSGVCQRCGQPDTVEHRVRFCARCTHLRSDHRWICDSWGSLPDSLTHHLLLPANPHLPRVTGMLVDLPDLTGDFHGSGLLATNIRSPSSELPLGVW